MKRKQRTVSYYEMQKKIQIWFPLKNILIKLSFNSLFFFEVFYELLMFFNETNLKIAKYFLPSSVVEIIFLFSGHLSHEPRLLPIWLPDVHRGDREFRLHHVRPQVQLAQWRQECPDVSGCDAPAVQCLGSQAETGGGESQLW